MEFRFAFHSAAFDRSVRFYGTTLGLEQAGGWNEPSGKGALFRVNATALIEIFGPAEGQSYRGPSPQAFNLGIRVEDRARLEDLHDHLERKGIELEGRPGLRPWGHWAFTARDPDGIPLYFFCDQERDASS